MWTTAHIYGKDDCGKCAAAAEKCARLGLEVQKRPIAELLDLHEGWREDEAVSVRAAFALWGPTLPIVRLVGVGVDFWSDYPGAMKALKGATR